MIAEHTRSRAAHGATEPQTAGARFIALLYHAVASANGRLPTVSDDEAAYAVSHETFVQSMDLLEQDGHATLTTAEVGAVAPPRAERGVMPVVVTFDDGWRSDVEIVLPTLVERGLSGVFFIPSGLLGNRGRLTRHDVALLHTTGMEVGSHTVTHARLTRLSNRQLAHELAASRSALEDIVGAPVLSLSVPEGFYDTRVIEHAWTAGYTAVYCSDWGVNPHRPGESLYRRCALRHHHTVNDVRCLVDQNPLYRLPRQVLFRVKGALQRQLRPDQYEQLRDGVLALPRWIARRRRRPADKAPMSIRSKEQAHPHDD